MSWPDATTLLPSFVAIVLALTVPWFTFRLALRQGRIARLEDRRAEFYIDLLTEALAEKQWFEYQIEDPAIHKRLGAHFTDLRLSPLERARLGSRGRIAASR